MLKKDINSPLNTNETWSNCKQERKKSLIIKVAVLSAALLVVGCVVWSTPSARGGFGRIASRVEAPNLAKKSAKIVKVSALTLVEKEDPFLTSLEQRLGGKHKLRFVTQFPAEHLVVGSDATYGPYGIRFKYDGSTYMRASSTTVNTQTYIGNNERWYFTQLSWGQWSLKCLSRYLRMKPDGAVTTQSFVGSQERFFVLSALGSGDPINLPHESLWIYGRDARLFLMYFSGAVRTGTNPYSGGDGDLVLEVP